MGFAREEEMMIENRAKTESKTEEMEIAMATIGLILLIAAAKHYASTSLAQQWRPLLVFVLLNLLLAAILFTSSSPTTKNAIKNSNEKKKKRKKINHNKKEVSDIDEKIKMGKKSKKSASSKISSCSGNNSWYLSSVQAVEDYFCKISDVEQEKINRLSLVERKNEHFEVCDDSITVNDDRTPINLSSTTTSSSKEDIDARVEAFIVMFRQQLAMDALRSTTSSVMQSRNAAGVVSK